MGKGSKQPQEQTVVQTNLPKYVRPYFERLLNARKQSPNKNTIPTLVSVFADESGDTFAIKAKYQETLLQVE